MKRSIFKRLFITYGITIVISFGILSVLLLKLFSQYFVDSKKDLLLEYGKKITQELALAMYTGRLDNHSLDENLKILDKFLDARIWIVDMEGKIFGVSSSKEEDFLGQSIDAMKLRELYRGKNIVESGSFGGKFKDKVLTAGYPIFYEDQFMGAVLVHADLPGVQKTFRDVYGMTILAIVFSGIISYAALYIQIKKISDPLREISGAAKVIAGGEFQKRLEIKTEDEIEELAKSFNNMAESLEKIEENRRNLIANISHDLRSPMTSIKGFVGGIIDGTIQKDMQNHYLNIVSDECDRLIKMTNEILELNDMQQKNISIEKTKFELNEMLRIKLISFESNIVEKKLDVFLSFYDEYAYVYADRTMMERVITNILDNAVKFTPIKGKICIMTKDNKNNVVVEIMNTALSTDTEDIKYIWDRFHKGDSTRNLYKSGFGLGLAIVKEMINQQSEEIWAERVDDGIKFYFTIEKAKI